MRTFTYVIIDDDTHRAQKTLATAETFPFLTYLGSAGTFDDGIDLVLEQQPQLLLLEIDPEDATSGLSLHFISELHRYLTQLPKVIITTKNDTLCLQAFKYGVFDYLIHPVESKELRKTFMRFEKESGIVLSKSVASAVVTPPVLVEKQPIATESNPVDLQLEEENEEAKDIVEEQELVDSTNENEENATAEEIEVVDQAAKAVNAAQEVPKESSDSVVVQAGNATKPLVICVKSYGDYRYIDAAEICYLQADNNSTDIHLNTGEMITAFKTLKHFEGVLTHPFVRIHNSYIVNIDYIGRIHTGNSVCHLKNSTVKLPFSKSYKENIDQIINSIASGNYLEI